MKYLLILLIIILFTSCRMTVKYAAYIPSQNRFVEFRNREDAFGSFNYRTGDTVIYNNEKVVIISH